MTTKDQAGVSRGSPAVYEIRVCGALDQKWCNFAEGMSLEVVHSCGEAETVIRVPVPDQSRLAGLLDALFGGNITVLSVAALPVDCDEGVTDHEHPLAI